MVDVVLKYQIEKSPNIQLFMWGEAYEIAETELMLLQAFSSSLCPHTLPLIVTHKHYLRD